MNFREGMCLCEFIFAHRALIAYEFIKQIYRGKISSYKYYFELHAFRVVLSPEGVSVSFTHFFPYSGARCNFDDCVTYLLAYICVKGMRKRPTTMSQLER